MSGGKGSRKARHAWMVLAALAVSGWGMFAGTCSADSAVLKVISQPEGAKVTVDTGQEGITPCALEVQEGKRSLTIRLRGHFVKTLEVGVSSAEPTEVRVTLVPIPTTMREGGPQYCQLPGVRD